MLNVVGPVGICTGLFELPPAGCASVAPSSVSVEPLAMVMLPASVPDLMMEDQAVTAERAQAARFTEDSVLLFVSSRMPSLTATPRSQVCSPPSAEGARCQETVVPPVKTYFSRTA